MKTNKYSTSPACCQDPQGNTRTILVRSLPGRFIDLQSAPLYKNGYSSHIVELLRVAMKKSLTSIGGSLGLIIDKAIADLYGINRTTEVEITPMQDGLSIRFLKTESVHATDAEVGQAARSVQKRYGKMMKWLGK